MATLLLWVGGCNLSFDASEYGPLPADDAGLPDDDTGNNGGNNGTNNNGASNNGTDNNGELPRGCIDSDGDQFGYGLACKKDQLDCDDTRAFVNPNAPEVCDSVDNDCDEKTDEGDDGNPLRTSCYTGDPGELGHPSTACRAGFLTCTEGQFPEKTAETCVGQVLPSSFGETEAPARCDGIDNDCDGTIDPLCDCPYEGAEEECYQAGPPNVAGVGQCLMGVRRCFRSDDEELIWGDCQGDIPPEPEACDNPGQDNDCDGIQDNVAAVGTSCESAEPGRCKTGRYRCENEVLTCNPVLRPVDETCNAVDDDCDGTVDEEVSNICGGCGALPAQPGDSCGPCNDGQFACSGDGTLECVGARELNACNGCEDLSNQPNTGCGACGRWECSGLNTVRCAEGNVNVCGGCGIVEDEARLGTRCGDCGRWVCADGNTLACSDPGRNICGGCNALTSSPGDLCGPCNDGRYQCSTDLESLRCTGATPLNACGGCGDLGANVGDPCGVACGRVECDPNVTGAVRCNDPGYNTCGGCGSILNAVGTPCGRCGSYQCTEGNTACSDGGNNSCGGCDNLPGIEGERCGSCGVWVCDGEDAMHCEDPGVNACGGCGDLGGSRPGDRCGDCGTYTCSLDKTRLLCNNQPFNACGGCGAINGSAPDTLCGICGTTVCQDGNTTVCQDSGLNGCLACGAISPAPGTSCANGYYACDGLNMSACDGREAGGSTMVRVWNYATEDTSCTSDAECGPAHVCVPLNNQANTPDTCSPQFTMVVRGPNGDVPLPYTFQTGSTIPYYRSGLLAFLVSDVALWRADQNPEVDPPFLVKNTTLSGNQQTTLAITNRRETCSGTDASTCTIQGAGTTCESGYCRTTCMTDAECVGTTTASFPVRNGICHAGTCRQFNIVQWQDNNVPIADRAKVRFVHMFPGQSDLQLRLIPQRATGWTVPPRSGQLTWVDSGAPVPIASAIGYGTNSAYADIAPGRYRVRVVNGSGFEVVSFGTGRDFKAGEIVTVVVYGKPGGNIWWAHWPNERTYTINDL